MEKAAAQPSKFRPKLGDRRVAKPKPAQPAEAAGTQDKPPRRKPGPPRPSGEREVRRDKPRGDGPRGEKPRGEGKPRATSQGGREQRHRFFVSCPRGLEQELAKELAAIGAGDQMPAHGGVTFMGELALAWKVNLWSRLGIRVLWQVGEGRYRSEEDLYEGAKAIDWNALFEVTKSIAITTLGKHSPLKSLNFVNLKIKDAVCDRFRIDAADRPSVETREPEVPITVFLSEDRYVIYLDLSGTPLNRRGYRVEPAAAPLNENLAAGLLKLAGWTPEVPLYDPMMGGGTLLLEAALMALNIAPGIRRHFAFENLRSFDMVEWQRLRKTAQAEAIEPHPLPIFGSDIDPMMVRATGLNLKAAGVLDCVRLLEADFLNVDPPTPTGLLLSNPPYGVRLGDEAELRVFYKALGDNLKQHFPGWRACMISGDPEFPKAIGLKSSRRIPLYNGPLECRLFEYELVRGSHR